MFHGAFFVSDNFAFCILNFAFYRTVLFKFRTILHFALSILHCFRTVFALNRTVFHGAFKSLTRPPKLLMDRFDNGVDTDANTIRSRNPIGFIDDAEKDINETTNAQRVFSRKVFHDMVMCPISEIRNNAT